VPYQPPTPSQQWCPPALTDAAGPLEAVAKLLRALSDDHAGVTRFCETAPSPGVRDAVDRFLGCYAGTLYTLSVTAADLGYNLRLAAESYRGTEQALTDAATAARPRTAS
jgi:hypothetical protein